MKQEKSKQKEKKKMQNLSKLIRLNLANDLSRSKAEVMTAHRMFLKLALCIFLGAFGCHGGEQNITPPSINNLLESDGGSAQLRMPWDFYWNVLLTPNGPLPPPQAASRLEMGRTWNGFVQASGLKTPSKGVASYRLVLNNLEKRPEGYSITFRSALSSYRAFVFPESRPHEFIEVGSGQVSLERDGAAPSRKWNTVPFKSEQTENWVVLVQVANHFHDLGGYRETPILSFGDVYQKKFETQQFGMFASVGVMLSIAFYSLMIYFRLREDRASLMLFGCATLAAFHVLGTNPVLYRYFDDTFSLFHFQMLALYIGPAATGLFVMFLHYSFPVSIPRSLRLAIVVFNVWSVVFIIFAPVSVFTYLRPINHGAIFAQALIGYYQLQTCVKRKLEGALFVLIGSLILLICLIHDVLAGSGAISTPPIIHFAVSIFIFFQGQLVAKKFAKALVDSVHLSADLKEKNAEILAFNANLERLVNDKTRDIRSLLDHIPQGVLKVGRDGLIRSDFSANLCDLLGTTAIANHSMMELIFAKSDLTEDQKDQLFQSINAIIDENSINFDINCDKFPADFTLHIAEKSRNIKATWNYVLGEEGEVQNILITLLDVTAEKALELRASKQMFELEIVQELLNIDAKKASKFLLSAGPLLEENSRLLGQAIPVDDRSIFKNLFVNAHTVKGAARTLGLKELANALHVMEDYYQEIFRHDATVDREKLRTQIDEAIRIFEIYQTINYQKLNRGEDRENIYIGRRFLEEHCAFLKDIVDGDITYPSDLVSSIKKEFDALSRIIFENLPTIFDTYKDLATKIAKDIGKEPPKFNFNIVDVFVPPEVSIALDRSMIHILRNALDHGIEQSDERVEAGKDPSGTLSIETSIVGPNLEFQISDDGRGLAIKRLLQKGMSLGLLSEESSPQEIAELVFAAGISTATSVTIQSGRGVGMDAVRSFIENLGGSISIRLRDAEDGNLSEEYRRFYFHIVIPSALRQDF